MIPDHSWSRTVFHDERHWRILTIHRFSGLSWVHIAKRWKFSEPKGWIRENTESGPVLEVTTCCLQGKYGVEIRIESRNKDHSQSRGSEFLMAWISWSQTWTTRSRMTTSRKPQRCSSKTMRWNRMHVLLQADQRRKQNHKDVFLPAHPQKLYLLGKELGPIVNHKIIRPPIIQCRRNWSISFVMVVLPREDDGAIEFWRMKDYLRNHFVHSRHWSDEKWKSVMAKGGGNKRQYHCCTDSSGEIFYFRALQGHSGRNLVDPSLQDNVLIPDDFFKYIYHVGCAINLHSIINSGLIPGGQTLSKRQTVFFLLVDPMDKEHKDPETIDLKAPRLAQYMHTAWKETSKHGVLGRHQTCSKERIKILSDAIERHHLLQHTPSLLYPEV